MARIKTHHRRAFAWPTLRLRDISQSAANANDPGEVLEEERREMTVEMAPPPTELHQCVTVLMEEIPKLVNSLQEVQLALNRMTIMTAPHNLGSPVAESSRQGAERNRKKARTSATGTAAAAAADSGLPLR
ncbi:hypothetical protein Ancab_026356 [Ancistrocladus abbreviatus]